MPEYICSICGKDYPVYCEEDITIGRCSYCGGAAVEKKIETKKNKLTEVKEWLKKNLKR